MTTPPLEPYTPIPGPEPRGPNRLLLLAAGVLAAFILLAVIGIGLVLAFTPSLRARIPFLAQVAANGAPPEAPDKYAKNNGNGPITIEDDFSNATGLWEQSQTLVLGGTYEMRLDQPNYDSYGLFLGASDVRDFDMAVDMTQVSGSPVAEYGIRFRQASPDEHLMFSISGNGFFRLLRVSDKTYSSVVPWTKSEVINTGDGAVNRLRVIADGPNITGFINDQQVLEYRDAVQSSGQLTLGLVTFEQGDLAVRFDNIAGTAKDESLDASGQPLPEVDLAESFEDSSSVPWSVGGAEIANGAYEVFVGGNVQSWQQPLPTGSSQVEGNFVLEVDATLVSGTEGRTAYGIMFGDGGEFDFYTLYLYPEGGIGLFRSEKDGSGAAIAEPGLHDAILPGYDATNKIKIEVQDDTLSITVNDELIGTLRLEPGTEIRGMVGLIVNSGDVEGVRARFDNFRLAEIP
jgi:hypothetical protein